jgi:hypothetical protein
MALLNGRLFYVPDFDRSASILALDRPVACPAWSSKGSTAPLSILSTTCGTRCIARGRTAAVAARFLLTETKGG